MRARPLASTFVETCYILVFCHFLYRFIGTECTMYAISEVRWAKFCEADQMRERRGVTECCHVQTFRMYNNR